MVEIGRLKSDIAELGDLLAVLEAGTLEEASDFGSEAAIGLAFASGGIA